VLVAFFVEHTRANMSWGRCTKMKLQDRLNLNKYEGLWFEQARDANFRFERGDCQQARYSVADDKNDTIYILNSQYRDDQTGFDTASGIAKCEGAQCKVRFSWYMPEGDYRVLYTDYTNYSVVYSCNDILGVAKAEYFWILSRE